jgi:hypothetical protein
MWMPTASSALDPNHYELRDFTGAHAQLAFAFGPAQVGVGGGVGMVGELDSDAININIRAPDQQVGLSLAALYHVSDSIVLGFDFMRFTASWKGVPEQPRDAAGMIISNADGSTAVLKDRREGETQAVNFVNAGITYHW